MGIQFLPTPKGRAQVAAGPLNLPAAFDIEKWAAKWVKVGPAVQAAAEREWIAGTNATADGWTVWRDPKTNKTHQVSLQSGTYVLLCRSQAVQRAVNAIAGNVGKERFSQEKAGHTITGADGLPVNDPGVFGDEALKKAIGSDPIMENEGEVKFNPVEMEGARVESPAAITLASRRARR